MLNNSYVWENANLDKYLILNTPFDINNRMAIKTFEYLDYETKIKYFLLYNDLNIEKFYLETYQYFIDYILEAYDSDIYYIPTSKRNLLVRSYQKRYFFIIFDIYKKDSELYENNRLKRIAKKIIYKENEKI